MVQQSSDHDQMGDGRLRPADLGASGPSRGVVSSTSVGAKQSAMDDAWSQKYDLPSQRQGELSVEQLVAGNREAGNGAGYIRN